MKFTATTRTNHHFAPITAQAIEPGRSIADRDERIAMTAYYKAEERGFTPGHELDDWLMAETEIDGMKSHH
jgi:hypothetical protein